METIYRADPISRTSLEQSAMWGGGVAPVVEPSQFGLPVTDLSSVLGFSSLGLQGPVNPLLLNQQVLHPMAQAHAHQSFLSPYALYRTPFGVIPALASRAPLHPLSTSLLGTLNSQLPIQQAILGNMYGGIPHSMLGISPQFIVTPQGLLQRVY